MFTKLDIKGYVYGIEMSSLLESLCSVDIDSTNTLVPRGNM